MNKVYEEVVETLIKRMEEGVNPWRKPWVNVKVGNEKLAKVVAINYSSNSVYEGINQWLLKPGYYLTFKQCKDLGGSIKKGAKGYMVVYNNYTDKKELTDEKVIKELNDTCKKELEEEKDNIERIRVKSGSYLYTYENDKWFFQKWFLKSSVVFSLGDCTNVKKIERKSSEIGNIFENVKAEDVVKEYATRTNLKVENRMQDSAYYCLNTDEVIIPEKEQFKGNEAEYYSTLFHELGHSTGHQSRLNRETLISLGEDNYGKEELVAEITSAMSLSTLGINSDDCTNNSASYLKSWAERIRGSKSLKDSLWSASNKAVEAVKLIFAR